MFKVVAVNVDNRPNEIPISKWIEKDEVYIVTEMSYLNIQNRLLGFKLQELNIDDCFPYQFFSSNRFRLLTEEDIKAQEAVKQLLDEQFKILEV